MISRLLLLVFTAGFAVVGLGCGPIQSTSYLIDAQVALEAARTAQANKLAPYEWTAANLYLHKAREEVGYSEFESAVTYAAKASKFANAARDQAMKAVRKDEPNPVPAPTP